MPALFGKLVSPAGLVAIVCFFLPWLTATCSGSPIPGLDQATGAELAAPIVIGGQQQPGNDLLYLAPAAAGVALLAGLLLFVRASLPASVAAVAGGLVAAAVPLYYMMRVTNEIQADPSAANFIDLQWEVGFWGAVVGGGLAALFALLSLGRAPQPPPPPTPLPNIP